jgi:rod shape determining protein RodA
LGFVILIVGQSFFNIASTLGLVPLVGVPLIFVSHGGTALAMALAESGVILSVSADEAKIACYENPFYRWREWRALLPNNCRS